MKILDFFEQAAERKAGVKLRGREPNMHEKQYGRNYCIDLYYDEDGNEMLSIYSNGEWDYQAPNKPLVSGKLAPPHSKTWIRRMVKQGIEPDFAKMDWAEYYQMRHP